MTNRILYNGIWAGIFNLLMISWSIRNLMAAGPTSMRQQGINRRLKTNRHQSAGDYLVWSEIMVPKGVTMNTQQDPRQYGRLGESMSFSNFRDFKFEGPINSFYLAW